MLDHGCIFIYVEFAQLVCRSPVGQELGLQQEDDRRRARTTGQMYRSRAMLPARSFSKEKHCASRLVSTN